MAARVLGLGLAVGLMATGAWADTLKLGVIAPLTGGGAPWGIAAAEAARIIAAEKNAEGGLEVGGERYEIEVIAYDDQYSAANSVAAYNRMVNQDGVRLILLHTSPAAVALKQNVEDDEVVAMTQAASPNAVDPDARFMFRVNNTPDNYMPALVAWLKDHMSERRVVLVNPNDEVGWTFAGLAEDLFEENGFEVLSSELFERSQKDFAPLFTKIMAQDPEVIDLGGVPPATTGQMVRQARDLGYTGKFIKTSGPSPREIIEAAGPDAVEGMLMVLFGDPANAGFQRLEDEFRASVGQDPNAMIVLVYDGFNVLLKAVQKAGDVEDTTAIAEAIPTVLPTPSVQGDDLTLGDNPLTGAEQQIMTILYIGEVRNGTPVVIGKVE